MRAPANPGAPRGAISSGVEAAFGPDQHIERVRRRGSERGRPRLPGSSTMPGVPAAAPSSHARQAARPRAPRHAIAAALLARRDRDLPPMREALVACAPAGKARAARRRPPAAARRRRARPPGARSRPSRRSRRCACTSVTASGDSRSRRHEGVDARPRVALARASECRGVFAAGAGEQRHRIADGKAQHAQRVMRDGLGQRDFAADVAGRADRRMKAGRRHRARLQERAQRIEHRVGLLGHHRVAGAGSVTTRTSGKRLDAAPARSSAAPSCRAAPRTTSAGQRTLRGGVEPVRVGVARGEIGVQHAGARALHEAQRVAGHPHARHAGCRRAARGALCDQPLMSSKAT